MLQRNSFIDFVKGYAIILVVIGHCLSCIFSDWKDEPFSRFIYSFHMPLFAFLSGLFFYPSVERYSLSNCFDFVKKRFISLMLPSLSWGVISIFINLVSRLIIHKPINISLIITQLFMSTWFLTSLFIISCLMYVCHCVGKSYRNYAFVLLCLIIQFIPDMGFVNKVKFLLPFFLMAIFLKDFVIKSEKITKVTWCLYSMIALTFFIMLCYFGFEYTVYRMPSYPYSFDFIKKSCFRLLIGTAGIFASFLFCSLLYKIQFNNKIFGFLGGITLPIYVIHQKFLIPFLFIKQRSESYIMALLLSTVVCVLTILTYFFLKKSKILNLFLFGGR